MTAFRTSASALNLTLYGTSSSRSLRALWALEEAEVDYVYSPVDLASGAGRQAPFIEINPGGKVPVLQVGSADNMEIIPESLAIVSWVGECFPDSGLVPMSGDANRAQYLRWTAFSLSELEQPLWTIAKHSFAIPEKYRVPEVKATARWEWRCALNVLEKGLGDRPWILGQQFTAADILIAHTLAWGIKRIGDLPSDALTHYQQRAFTRPACQRALAREGQT